MRPFTPVPKPVKKNNTSNSRLKSRLVKSNKPIARRSVKRIKDDRVYLKLRSEYLTNNPYCQAKLSSCTGPSTEIHHTYAGADRNKYYLITPTWMGVCRNCHNEIHDNPKHAKTLGFLK